MLGLITVKVFFENFQQVKMHDLSLKNNFEFWSILDLLNFSNQVNSKQSKNFLQEIERRTGKKKEKRKLIKSYQ